MCQVCLTNIQVAESQSIMETRFSEYGFLNCSLKFEKCKGKEGLVGSAWECKLGLKYPNHVQMLFCS